ncbi:hypothetical protein [Actinomyces procaprae]|uniref:variant leucine-rich repeat-containing protein n=1 Tax=Actinomyces procaprae TaxID=2560010 RepID=UPI00109D8C4A|nr:hypothetical protein [Actinomyces procaprae]
MSQPQDDLVARASDPDAELKTLHELANNYPGLRPYIAENPRTYPALLEWLAALGDPAVDAALARRNAAAATQALSTEQARAAAQAAAAEAAPAQAPTGQLPPSDPAGLTQALPQSAVPGPARPSTPERRPIMEGRQVATGAAAPTAAYPYQQPQPTQQAPYQAAPYQAAPYQAAPYQQGAPQAVAAQPAAGNQGVFGVGTPEPEEQHTASNRWLWILGAVALVLVVALIVWYLSSDHGNSTSRSAEDPAQAAAPQVPASAPEQVPSTPSPTPSPTASQNLVAPAPDGALEMSAFTTPSGNISCVLGDDSVSCTVNEHDFVPTDASCNNSSERAFTVSVGTSGQAEGSCGTSFSSAGASLNYGASAKNDSFACTSSESGIECWSQLSGDGFRLSRSQVEPTTR